MSTCPRSRRSGGGSLRSSSASTPRSTRGQSRSCTIGCQRRPQARYPPAAWPDDGHPDRRGGGGHGGGGQDRSAPTGSGPRWQHQGRQGNRQEQRQSEREQRRAGRPLPVVIPLDPDEWRGGRARHGALADRYPSGGPRLRGQPPPSSITSAARRPRPPPPLAAISDGTATSPVGSPGSQRIFGAYPAT